MASASEMEANASSRITDTELVPRFVLVEDAVEDKRVLEVEPVDLRSLFRLGDNGARQVVATSARPERFPPSILRGREIDLVSMEVGRLDFDDRSFDVVIVGDLDTAIRKNPAFLEELRRILDPRGFCLLAFSAHGRGLSQIVGLERGSSRAGPDPFELVGLIRQRFDVARFYRQTPFVGIAISTEGVDPLEASVSLDGTLSGPAADPSHLIAICGPIDPVPEDRTLIELPLSDFQALAENAMARTKREVVDLRSQLEKKESELVQRDASLKAISAKLGPLRKAIQVKLQSAEIPLPADDDDDSASLELIRTIAEKDSEIARLEAELQRLGSQSAQDSGMSGLEDEIEILRRRLSEAERRAEEASYARSSLIRVREANQTQEARIQELEEQLEEQQRHRSSMDDDFGEGQRQLVELTRRLESESLRRAQEARDLLARLSAMSDALKESERVRGDLFGRVRELETLYEDAEARREYAERQLQAIRVEAARAEARETDAFKDAEEARLTAHRAAEEIAALHRSVAERDRQLEVLRATTSELMTHKTALELAASTATRELEEVRDRLRVLRNERDTLAQASSALAEERDEALKGLGVTRPSSPPAPASAAPTPDMAVALADRDSEIARLEDRIKALLDSTKEAEQMIGAALAEKARAEAEAVEATTARRELEAERSKLNAQASFTAKRLSVLEKRLAKAKEAEHKAPKAPKETEAPKAEPKKEEPPPPEVAPTPASGAVKEELEKAKAAREEAREALGITLRQAAELSIQLSDAEKQLTAQKARINELEHLLSEAESGAPPSDLSTAPASSSAGSEVDASIVERLLREKAYLLEANDLLAHELQRARAVIDGVRVRAQQERARSEELKHEMSRARLVIERLAIERNQAKTLVTAMLEEARHHKAHLLPVSDDRASMLLEEKDRELEDERQRRAIVAARLVEAQDDVKLLKAQLSAPVGSGSVHPDIVEKLTEREVAISELQLACAARDSEIERLAGLLQQAHVQQGSLADRVQELESTLEASHDRVSSLQRDVAEQAERLRQLTRAD